MEKVTGIVRFKMKNERYAIAYEIEGGLINLDKSAGYHDEVYGRAFHKVSKEHQETIEKMVMDSNLNLFEDDTNTEYDAKTEDDTLEKGSENQNDTLTENDSKIENGTINKGSKKILVTTCFLVTLTL